jgi:predicted Rossmann fold flavoprotein
VVGGGAAGYFGAITCAESHEGAEVKIFEGTHQPLYKVGISGGGRCNVTHNCFDPAVLVEGYPRGARELLSAFYHFQPRDTVEWFEKRGVRLKAEADGRMFPVTDQSATIIECLQQAATKAGVVQRIGDRVVAIQRSSDGTAATFDVQLKSGELVRFDRVLIATGSSPQGYKFAEALGHTIVPCVPSLFTFNIKDRRLAELQGLTFPTAHLSLSTGDKRPLVQSGPVLITHWGLSGPAVLKLSAWGARQLFISRYQAELTVNWVAEHNYDSMRTMLLTYREEHPTKVVTAGGVVPIAHRFWERIATIAGVDAETTWSHITKQALDTIAKELTGGVYKIIGKGEFKEEFVTCGGVKLKEVDFRTMESRICPGLYLAGEILDIDGITGGYNFQSAWTTGWIAGKSMGSSS